MDELVSRRGLLKGSLAVGAALGLAGIVQLPVAGPGRVLLSAAEATIVAAVAEVMFPKGALPIDGLEANVVARVDRILVGVAAAQQAGFRYLLRAMEWGALSSHGARFSRLPKVARAEVLTAWSDPSLLPRRIASDALKSVMSMAYFGHPDVQAAMGYRAACGVRGVS